MSAASDILSNYQHVIEDLSLIPGGKGIFDVTIDGEMIYSKFDTKRHANPGEVLELFASAVGDNVRRYGT